MTPATSSKNKVELDPMLKRNSCLIITHDCNEQHGNISTMMAFNISKYDSKSEEMLYGTDPKAHTQTHIAAGSYL